MNLVLVGYRGTGKTAVAKLAAGTLGMSVFSMDPAIVEKAGMSIPEIVEKYGWERFRDLETEVCREVAGRDGLVIDTGGGVILREENRKLLRSRGVVVWLTAAVPTIISRIKDDTQRPSLTGRKSFTDEVAEVLAEREPLYRAAAHHVVDTDGKELEEVAAEVAAAFRRLSAEQRGAA